MFGSQCTVYCIPFIYIISFRSKHTHPEIKILTIESIGFVYMLPDIPGHIMQNGSI